MLQQATVKERCPSVRSKMTSTTSVRRKMTSTTVSSRFPTPTTWGIELDGTLAFHPDQSHQRRKQSYMFRNCCHTDSKPTWNQRHSHPASWKMRRRKWRRKRRREMANVERWTWRLRTSSDFRQSFTHKKTINQSINLLMKFALFAKIKLVIIASLYSF